MTPFTIDDPRVLRTAAHIEALARDLRRLRHDPVPALHLIEGAPLIERWHLGYRFEPALFGVVRDTPTWRTVP